MKKITLMMSMFALMVGTGLSAQNAFTEDFEDANASDRWFPVTLGTNSPYDFAAKYSDLGITAPEGGGTYCAKLQANVIAGDDGKGTSNFLGLLPKKDLTGEYTMTFDAYMFYEGTSGTSETILCGVGKNSDPENEGHTFGMFADNGSGRDVRLYKDGSEQKYGLDDALYTYAGISQNFNLEAPAHSVYQEAVVLAGEDVAVADPGNQWVKMSVEVSTGSVVFKVNGKEFARFKEGSKDGAAMIGYVDLFTGSVNTTSFLAIDNVKIVDGVTLGTNDTEIANVSLYPNPAQGFVNFALEGKGNVEIFNISGQRVMGAELNGTTSVDISGLNSGMYFAKVTTLEGAVKSMKLQVK